MRMRGGEGEILGNERKEGSGRSGSEGVSGAADVGRARKKSKVKSPTRKPDVWATQVRLRIYRPGHPSRKSCSEIS